MYALLNLFVYLFIQDPNVCLNFANQFLDWLKDVITIEDPRSSYTISFNHPFQQIKVEYAGVRNSVLAERHMK